MVLQEKLKSTRMATSENVASYLTRLSQVRDELAAIGEKVDGSELVRTVVNGVTNPWSVLSTKMHTSSRNLLKVVSSLQVGEVWPWGQAMSQVLSHESQLLHLGYLL